jgi:hypothetical protein
METILKIAADRYDAGPGISNPIALMWAAEHAVSQIGVEAVKAGIRKLNAQRNKFGLIGIRFDYGHQLF